MRLGCKNRLTPACEKICWAAETEGNTFLKQNGDNLRHGCLLALIEFSTTRAAEKLELFCIYLCVRLSHLHIGNYRLWNLKWIGALNTF